MHRSSPLPFLAIPLALAALALPALAQAATAQCMGEYGSCEVSNDGFDEAECMCADGGGGGFGGGNEWAGLSEVELGPICEEILADFCGPFIPPEEVYCWSFLGDCAIDNEPDDTLYCNCADGSTPTLEGGMAWAGWSDDQLYDECEAQLDMLCLPPPGSMECANGSGMCIIDNMPTDFLACECTGGDGGSTGGGNDWAGYSELELFDECASQLVDFCGGPMPHPPWAVCSSSLGECLLDNDPEDRLECTCADGEMVSMSGGSEWAGLSYDELFMECEEQLFEGCSVSAESSSGSDTGDTGDTDSGSSGSTGAGSSTGEPGNETGIVSPPDGSSGTPDPGSTSDDPTGGASESGDGGATGGEGGCSCSTSDRSNRNGWALSLLGLVTLGLSRRRRARAA